MGRFGKLIKNSAIFAISNMSSSLISFLLVRFYTELLSAEQYGTIDLITTTASMLIPFFTIAIVEAVLRFSIDSVNREHIFTAGIVISIAGSIVYLVIGSPVLIRLGYGEYSYWIAALIFLQSTGSVVSQFVRGVGRISVFAIYGVIKTAVLVLCNIVLLLGLGWRIEGYLLSILISEIISAVFLVIKAKLWKYISLQFDLITIKSMVKYSLPLVPSSLSLWLLSATDKFMLVKMIGMNANGLYAVAHKIPTLISTVNEFFLRAWQLSAVEEANSQSKDRFYTDIFNAMASFLFIGASIILMMLKSITQILVSENYTEVWRYSPYLVLAMIASSFANFLGTNYTVTKRTKGALTTSIIGAGINIALNFVFIRLMGIIGAGLATMISYTVTALIRGIDTRRDVKIQYAYASMFISVLVLLVQATAISFSWKYERIFHAVSILCICILNRKVLVLIKSAFMHKRACK